MILVAIHISEMSIYLWILDEDRCINGYATDVLIYIKMNTQSRYKNASCKELVKSFVIISVNIVNLKLEMKFIVRKTTLETFRFNKKNFL